MAQIVHDLAPAARLSFATGNNSQLQFANNIRALATAGANVIVDDLLWFEEPMFQDGPVSVAVNDVTAGGVAYFASAANFNIISAGKNVGSYEAPAFRSSGSCPSPASFLQQCMDFDPGAAVDRTYGIRVPPGRFVTIDLQWAQPWNGVTTDLDAYLINSTGIVVQGINSNVTNTQRPFEFFGHTNTSGTTENLNLVINRYTGTGGGDTASPRLKFIVITNGGGGAVPTEYTASSGGDIIGPTTYGHFAAANTMSVAAVPYNNSSAVEPYSSRGPAKLYFGPVNGTTPAPPLTTPQALSKPDFAATDGGQNTFFGSFDGTFWRFFGTSAAAPHAAAVAALIRDGDPAASVAQVKAALRNTARAVGSFGVKAVGKGLIDATAAVASRLPGVTINDVSTLEGNSGTHNLNFTVHLSKPSDNETSLEYSTVNGTATGSDFVVAAAEPITFPAGTVNRTVSIAIKGDTTVEPTERFTVKLSAPNRLKLTDATGTGTIPNDD